MCGGPVMISAIGLFEKQLRFRHLPNRILVPAKLTGPLGDLQIEHSIYNFLFSLDLLTTLRILSNVASKNASIRVPFSANSLA